MASNLYSQTELGSEDDFTVLGTNGTAADPDAEIKGFTVFGSTQTAYTGAVAGPGNVVVNGVLAVSSGAYFVGNSTFTNAAKIFINDGAAGQLLRRNTAGSLEWVNSSALGDNLGNHIATTTLTANYGIAASTITASTVTLTGFINTTSTAGYAMDGYTILRSSSALLGTFVGRDAGRVNTGAQNSFLGFQAGYSNTVGSQNSFLGYNAGYSNTTGNANLFFGASAGYKNTTGNSNYFAGQNVGHENTTGSFNSFIGTMVGYSNTTGEANSVMGYIAAFSNTTGMHNSGIGYVAGNSNTTGSYNTFLGSRASYRNETGSQNSVVGYNAGGSGAAAVNSFSSSTIMGAGAGYNITTGGDNTLYGWQAGYNIKTGTGNIVIGYNQLTPADNTNNFLNIGGLLYGDLSARTIGISTRAPQAALDIVSTGTASNIYAQIWRNASGTIVSSMTSEGVLYPQPAGAAVPASVNLSTINATATTAYGGVHITTNVVVSGGLNMTVSTDNAVSMLISTGTGVNDFILKLSSSGVLTAKSGVTYAGDLAELYPALDEAAAAEVVMMDAASGAVRVRKAVLGGGRVLGVVSTRPGVTIGAGDIGEHPGAVPVALSGRVPVKVSDENGRIKAGDFLGASGIAGRAAKAARSGMVIGMALEDQAPGEDIVLCFVNPQYWVDPSEFEKLKQEFKALKARGR